MLFTSPIPKKLENLLLGHETVENCFKLSQKKEKCTVFVTTHRLVCFKGMSIRDIDYKFISSIELSRKHNIPFLIAGVVLSLLAVILFSKLVSIPIEYANTGAAIVALILGLVFILLGIFDTEKSLALNVVGMPQPYQLSGHESEL